MEHIGYTPASIPLSRGLFALVDAADLPFLSQWTWYAAPASDRSTFYAARGVKGADGSRRQLRMHNALMRPASGQLVDHINREGLDNRRVNLRLCTFRENMANRSFPVGKSGFRGVYRYGNRWSANISRDGQSKVIGVFDTPIAAAAAYDAAAKAAYGAFAVLNFPEAANDAA